MAYGTATSTPPGPPVQNDSLQEVPAEPIPEEEQERLQRDDPACAHHKHTLKQKMQAFYNRNFGLVLVFLAQTCGSVMNTAAKLLATGYETKFHAMQIIFIRMSCTTILGMLYMVWHKTPDFPLGAKGIRWLLVLRGTCGFIGLFGLYCTLEMQKTMLESSRTYANRPQTRCHGSTSPTPQSSPSSFQLLQR